MHDNKSGKLTLIVILAAVVAALTTAAVFFLRARAKRRAMCGKNTALDYELDDCDCYDEACGCSYCQEDEAGDVEETVE